MFTLIETIHVNALFKNKNSCIRVGDYGWLSIILMLLYFYLQS